MSATPEYTRLLHFLEDCKDADGDAKYEKALSGLAPQKEKSLIVDWNDLYVFDTGLATMLLNEPQTILRELVAAASQKMQMRDPAYLKEIQRVRVRIRSPPVEIPIRLIRAAHIGSLIMISGVITRATVAKPLITDAMFICLGCAELMLVPQPYPTLQPPEKCPTCQSRRLLLDPSQSKYMDVQWLTAQERPEDLPPGQMPHGVRIRVRDDLVGKVNPGDRVRVTCTIEAVQKDKFSLTLDSYLEANHIEAIGTDQGGLEITPEDEEAILELAEDPGVHRRLLQSIAPSIKGHEEIKESILYLLFRGVAKELPDVRIKGDINVLLVGDPGTGKSQLLQYAAKTAPRGILTTGRGSTAAGLTAAAIKEKGGSFILEAGALVLADQGVCCIAENQLVVTPRGLIRIKELRLGDTVVNYDNGPNHARVKHVLKRGVKPLLRLTLYTGDTIECTPDHELLTQRGMTRADRLKKGDYLKIPAYYGPHRVKNKDIFEIGFIHGFGLSDITFNEGSTKNALSYCASTDKEERSKYVSELIEKHYGCPVGNISRPASTVSIHGKDAQFSEGRQYYFSCLRLKGELTQLLRFDRLPSGDPDYHMGLLAGILSTDTCVSHKKGRHGVKHEIAITLGRKKYGRNWLLRKMKLVNSILHRYGILSVIRGRKLVISSLKSYNRVAELYGALLVGRNKAKLIRVEPGARIQSYDDILDEEYHDWFRQVKFNTGKTVSLGLSSRIRRAKEKNRVTTALMETLRAHWSEITGDPFNPPDKPYLLNPIKKIEETAEKPVYDLTIEGAPNFLLSGGIVHNCIDEMDKMREEDRGAIHPAMEQQVVNIAKGGIVATLNARTAILAAANPVLGRYNPYQTISENINLPFTLLNRFDLIFVIRDIPNPEKDTMIVRHIISSHRGGGYVAPVDPVLLRKYIAYAKRIDPILSEESGARLEKFYLEMREASMEGGEASAISITARQIEGLIRITEARARLHLREETTVEDAEAAIALMQRSLEQVGVDVTTGKIDIDILYSGKPRSLQMQLQVVLKTIYENLDGAIRDDALFEACSANGISRTEAVRLIGVLMRDGTIYSPKPGYYRRTG